MKLKILIGVLVFLIVLNLATIGTFLFVHFGHGPRKGRMRLGGPRTAARMMDRARALTPFRSEEREQLMDLLHDLRQETRELRERINDLEGEALRALHEDPISKAKVDSLLGEISAVQLEVSKKATAKLIETQSFLTKAQQRIFYDAILEARAPRPGFKRQLLKHPRRHRKSVRRE